MIQDISPCVFSNNYENAVPDEKSIVFHFKGEGAVYYVLAKEDISDPFPKYGEISADKHIYLFSVDNVKYFLADGNVKYENYEYVSVRKIRYAENAVKLNTFAMFTALHLYIWYSSNIYCGKCGNKTFADEKFRALRCNCGNIIFPRINPAVIVGITNGDKLLITRYATDRKINYDALVAGFTEIGETFEQTVEREVMEETGLKVKNIRYYKSQPWGFSGSILAGYFCDADGDTDIKIDESELKYAKWVSREDITGQPDNLSLTNEMMMYFKSGMI